MTTEHHRLLPGFRIEHDHLPADLLEDERPSPGDFRLEIEPLTVWMNSSVPSMRVKNSWNTPRLTTSLPVTEFVSVSSMRPWMPARERGLSPSGPLISHYPPIAPPRRPPENPASDGT